MDHVVAYDISTGTPEGERRLAEVAKVCEGYGVRVQKSVFEVRLTETQCERLISDLLDVIDQSCDRVLIYRIHGDINASRVTFGRQEHHEHGHPWIL